MELSGYKSVTMLDEDGQIWTAERMSRFDFVGCPLDDGYSYDMFMAVPKIICEFALADVNDIRTALAIGEGKLEALPPGMRSNPQNCVLARALSNGWRSFIGVGESNLYHPVEGMSEEKIQSAFSSLKQMDFSGELSKIKVSFPSEGSSDESPVIWDEADGFDEDDFTECWHIEITHTPAMERLVNLFDDNKIPELLL